MSYLVDSDTCSAYLKNDRRVVGRFVQYFGRLHVSVITAGELFTWGDRKRTSADRRETIEAFLKEVRVLNMTKPVSRVFGRLQAQLLDAGRPTPSLDLLIAATALHHGLIMVTHNVRDYEHVPGLTVVDWLAP